MQSYNIWRKTISLYISLNELKTSSSLFTKILLDVNISVDLLSLLRWRSAPEGIGETLSRLTRVDGAETVKFLQDVLDALFAMFSTDDGNSTQYSGHVFQALVSLLIYLDFPQDFVPWKITVICGCLFTTLNLLHFHSDLQILSFHTGLHI